MKIFLTSVTSLMFFLLAVKQLMMNSRVIQPDEDKMKLVPWIGMASSFNVLCGSFCTDTSISGLPADILLAVSAIYLMTLSFLPFHGLLYRMILAVIALEVLSGTVSLLTMAGIMPQMPDLYFLITSVSIAAVVMIVYIYGIYVRLKDVRHVMRTGSVWTNVTLSVDSVYLSVILMSVMSYIAAVAYAGAADIVCITVFSMIFLSIFIALAIRIINSSAFVVMNDHERKIVESMKISHVDAARDISGTAVLYKNLYDRVLEYFAESKPYLDPNLTINEVAAVVFSNRLYISKAISQFTGRNFCQFVNYYRVVHAIELYRGNSNLKVLELANLSGFNSVVSFGMAFKLYMGEKPGDWCRREKSRLDKLKK